MVPVGTPKICYNTPMNISQKLGIKVFYYFLSKRISIGIIVLVVAVIVAFSKENLTLKLAEFTSIQTATNSISYFINGIFIVSIVLIIIGFFVSYIKYISCDFTLGENAFNIRRGFLTKREISIPYRQIQNINIEQSLRGKMLGIGKLVILTEGDHSENNDRNKEGVFEVIDYDLAHRVREYILVRTNIQATKDIIQ